MVHRDDGAHAFAIGTAALVLGIREPTASRGYRGLDATRRAAWRHQGVIVLRPEEIRDGWPRQALVNEANRLHGRRPGDGR